MQWPCTCRAPRFRPGFEKLEDRLAPAGATLAYDAAAGRLTVHGDAGDNDVLAALTAGGYLELTLDGQRFSSDPNAAAFSAALAGARASSLTGIRLDGGDGHDRLAIGDLAVGGGLTLAADDVLDVTGQVSAGRLSLTGQLVTLTGAVTAAGALHVTANNVLHAGALSAGGDLRVEFTGQYLATTAGQAQGQEIVIGGGERLFSSGSYRSPGGRIDLLADAVTLIGATVDASGAFGGGSVRIGGDYQGRNPDVANAQTTTVDPTTVIRADALERGDGGRVIVWADQTTEFYGEVSARGGPAGGDGGFLEVSGKGDLTFGGRADAGAPAGTAGTLLLDPKNLVVSSSSGWVTRFNLVDPTPTSGDQFGQTVVPLSTGNVVVTDVFDDFGASDAGAVHLFNGSTGALISTLFGTHANDWVGSDGITLVGNGNYVVSSSQNWDNGAATNAGAVTWGSGTAGISGAVSAANSLVGSTSNDTIGISGVTVLSNGNYVVRSSNWDNGAATEAGAVTWGNGMTGISGVVSAANSLVGSISNDQVGFSGVTPLTNGNYVVISFNWDNGAATNAGAVTFGNGATGIKGVVTAANSLVGSTSNDHVGFGFVTVLSNGNYVVISSSWNNGAAFAAGAVTWGNGTTGTSGVVTAANSLVGSTSNNLVGNTGITALSNGNYVVRSSFWDNGAATDAGAVTWGNGMTGISGAVSAANSLVGSTSNDQVGSDGVTALSNGNYVVNSRLWNNGAVNDAGAVTWGNGSTGISGDVSAANSLVGSTFFDAVGGGGVIVLSNGNYVVRSFNWNNGAGAATWGNGASGISGVVSAANSLVGTTSGDQVGGNVTALSNGNYVVSSSFWDNGAAINAGAVTWGNGLGGTVGTVSAANSLVGSSSNDFVGNDGVTALSNGNYVVRSIFWDGAAINAGAVTWGNGAGGTVGAVSAANSLVGSTSSDFVGSGVTALSNGNYVVRSNNWRNGAAANAGAVTWGNGSTGTSGTVSAANSLVGSTSSDFVGSGGVTALGNGNYVVRSNDWDNGAAINAGAVSWGNGLGGTVGVVSAANSLVGSTSNDQVGGGGVTILGNGNYVVLSHQWDNGATVNAGAVTFGGATGVSGAISASNSIVGATANTSLTTVVLDGVNDTFLARFLAEGGGRVTAAMPLPAAFSYGTAATASLVVHPAFLTQTLNTGTAVLLQASNDITINSAISVNNPGGNGGALTLQAGRSIFVNADISTDDGSLTLIANDLLANGVVDSQRDPGVAVISMAAFTSISTGTGSLTIDLRNGAGKTHSAAGDISLQSLTAGNLTIDNTAGAIIGNDPITINGTANLSAAGAITFDTFGTNFAGTVNATAATVSLRDHGALALGSVLALGGGLTVLAGGTLTATFVQSNGPSSFTGSSIALNDGVFNGPVSLTSAGNASLSSGNQVTLGNVNVGGNLSVTAFGAIFDNGTVGVGGTTMLSTTSSVTLDSGGNNFGGTVLISNATSVTLVDTGAIDLGILTISGNLNVTAGGAFTDSGNLSVAGTTTLVAGSILLNNAGNSFPGAVTLNVTSNASLVNSIATSLAGSTIGGNLALTSGALTQTGPLNVGGTAAFNSGISAITLTNAANDFGAVAITTIGAANATVIDANALTVGTVTVAGNLFLTAGGALAGSSVVTVTGTTTLSGSGNIVLDNPSNNFTGTVAVSAGAHVGLADINALALGAVTASGSLTISAGGAVTQSAALTIGGGASLTATTVTLTTAGNNFGGAVAFQVTGNVSITDVNALVLGGGAVGGTLTVTASGAVTETAPLAVAGTLTFIAGANPITLNSAGNDFSTVVITSAGNVQLNDAGSIILGASAISGFLAVTAGTAITQSGSLTVSGTTTLIAGGNVILNFGNSLGGSVSVSTPGNASLSSFSPLSLGTSSVGGNLSVSASTTISQTGFLTVFGTSSFSSGTINLPLVSFLGGVVSLSAATANVHAESNLLLGNTSVFGVLTLTAIDSFFITVTEDFTAQNTVNFTAGGIVFNGSLAVGNQTVTLDATENPVELGSSTTIGGSGQLICAVGFGVIVGPGETLGGTGTVDTGAGALLVQAGGTLAPGAGGPGTLTIDGNLSLSAGSTLAVELNGTGGGLFDQLDVLGAVSLGGATLAASLGYSPSVGHAFQIISNDLADGVTGTFSTGASATSGPVTFGINYAGGTSNDVVLTVTSTGGGGGGPPAIPTANNDIAAVPEDSAATIISVLANDLGFGLFIDSVTQGLFGTVTNFGTHLTYEPTVPNFTGIDTFTYVVEDSDGDQAMATVIVAVTPVNDAPTVSVPLPQTYSINSPKPIAGIAIDDLDAGSLPIQVFLFADHGTLTLANPTGSTGNGTAQVVITGTLTSINAILGGLSYQANRDYGGSDTLSVFVDDLGSTGGGSQFGFDSFALTPTPGQALVQNSLTFAGKKDLVVTGTASNDTITVALTGTSKTKMTVKVNGVIKGKNFVPTGQIMVYGLGGNDTITVKGTIKKRAFIDGGVGDDTITGGGGGDILLGGGGTDRLLGSGGRNLLIGGAAADTLTGGIADDILIGGSTAHDDNGAALDALMKEWASANPFLTRVNHLRNGTGLNGPIVLSESPTATVFDDLAIDTLIGGSGSDWFWRFGADTNGDTGEQIN